MSNEFNIGNSIFTGHNDIEGIFLCGYEWGYGKTDQAEDETGLSIEPNFDAKYTFSNKSPCYGEKAFKWRYDNRIIKWFELWGHPLNREGLGSDFDKSFIQTNWCSTQDNKIDGNCYEKLMQTEQINNFINHISGFKPKITFFFGSRLINALQDNRVTKQFTDIMGKAKSNPDRKIKDFDGRKFFISFQDFEKCQVICFPHPSSTRALSDKYIELFSDEVSQTITNYKQNKGIN